MSATTMTGMLLLLRTVLLLATSLPATAAPTAAATSPIAPGGAAGIAGAGPAMARARTLTEFQAGFPDEASCAAFLFERRWPKGFVCPACGDGRAALLRSRAHTYECLACGRQTSITAGAVL